MISAFHICDIIYETKGIKLWHIKRYIENIDLQILMKL